MASLSDDSDVDEELSRDLRSLDEVLQGEQASERSAPVDTQDHDENLSKLKMCLEKNLELQGVLKEQLIKVEAGLALNKQKMALISNPRRNKAIVSRTLTLWSFRRGRYFRDHLGRTPPTGREKGNEELNTRVQEMYNESAWRRPAFEKRLLDSVRIQVVEAHTRPLLDQMEMAPQTRKDKIKQQINKIKKTSDEQLFEGMTSDNIDWSSLSYEMFGHSRSSSDCWLHWTNCVSPLLNKEEWSQEEDCSLVKLAQRHGERDWVKISKELGTQRSAFDCLRRFQTCRAMTKGGKWTPEEDAKLMQAVSTHGRQNWTVVSNQVGGGRTGANCYHRWTMSLCPELKRGKWSEEEDQLLLEGVRVHGNRSWSKVCQYVPGRNQSQCRERYVNVLDSNLKRGPWSQDEDRLLLEVCKAYEGKSIPWSMVAKQIPHRTDAMCNNRWRQLNSDEEVFEQYVKQALKRATTGLGRSTKKIDGSVFKDSLPDSVKEQLEGFKRRYLGKEKRRPVNEIRKKYYPSPNSIVSMDNSSFNDLLTFSHQAILQHLPPEVLKSLSDHLNLETVALLFGDTLSSGRAQAGGPSTSAAGKSGGHHLEKAVAELLRNARSTGMGLSSVASSNTGNSRMNQSGSSILGDGQSTSSGSAPLVENSLLSDTMATTSVSMDTSTTDWLEILMSQCEDLEDGGGNPYSLTGASPCKPLPASFHEPPTSSTPHSAPGVTPVTSSTPPSVTPVTSSTSPSVTPVTSSTPPSVTPVTNSTPPSVTPVTSSTPPNVTPVTSSTPHTAPGVTHVTSSTSAAPGVTPVTSSTPHSVTPAPDSDANHVTVTCYETPPTFTSDASSTAHLHSPQPHTVTTSTSTTAHTLTPLMLTPPTGDRPVHIGSSYFSRDLSGKIVRLTKKNTKPGPRPPPQFLRGAGDFPLGPRFIVQMPGSNRIQMGVAMSEGEGGALVRGNTELPNSPVYIDLTSDEESSYPTNKNELLSNKAMDSISPGTSASNDLCPSQGSLSTPTSNVAASEGALTAPTGEHIGDLLGNDFPALETSDMSAMMTSDPCWDHPPSDKPLPATITPSAVLEAIRTCQPMDEEETPCTLVGDETMGCIALPGDSTMARRYCVDLKVVDSVTLINAGVSDLATPLDNRGMDDECPDLMDYETCTQLDGLDSADSAVTGTQNADSAFDDGFHNADPASSCHSNDNRPHMPPASSSQPQPQEGQSDGGYLYTRKNLSNSFSELELILAAQLLCLVPGRSDHRYKEDRNRRILEAYLEDMAGFDLPRCVALEADALMAPYEHVIVYEPNTACYFFGGSSRHANIPHSTTQRRTAPLPAARRKDTSVRRGVNGPRNLLLAPSSVHPRDDVLITTLSNDDLISQHFALSRVPIPPVKPTIEVMIPSAILSEYQDWVQVYAGYELLLFDRYYSRQTARPARKRAPRQRKRASGASGRGRQRRQKESAAKGSGQSSNVNSEPSVANSNGRKQRGGRKRKAPSEIDSSSVPKPKRARSSKTKKVADHGTEAAVGGAVADHTQEASAVTKKSGTRKSAPTKRAPTRRRQSKAKDKSVTDLHSVAGEKNVSEECAQDIPSVQEREAHKDSVQVERNTSAWEISPSEGTPLEDSEQGSDRVLASRGATGSRKRKSTAAARRTPAKRRRGVKTGEESVSGTSTTDRPDSNSQ